MSNRLDKEREAKLQPARMDSVEKVTQKKATPKKKAATARKPKLTVKETIFIKELIRNGGNQTQAALKAYDTDRPKVADAIARENLAKPRIRDLVEAELEKQGITLELAIKPVAKALVAKKKEFMIDKDGEKIEVGEADDIEMQLKGHDRAMKLMGLNERANDGNTFNFNIDKAAFGGEFVKK